MVVSKEHAARVATELQEAGASAYGASKFASRYLPNVIHPDEHIMGAVYGRYDEGGGLLSMSAGMLVATDKRIVFLDHKPGFTSTDEITYDVVSGVKKVTSALASTLTLHTRVGDYVIRYANADGIDKFINYIENRRIEVGSDQTQTAAQTTTEAGSDVVLDQDSLNFLRKHEVAVISTIDRTGNLHGAAIYYFVDDKDRICMATKTSTQKARDMFANQQAALTVYDANTLETVQLQGHTVVATDMIERQAILNAIIKLRNYNGEMRMPPVTTIHEEGYVAMYIVPTSARYTNYKERLDQE